MVYKKRLRFSILLVFVCILSVYTRASDDNSPFPSPRSTDATPRRLSSIDENEEEVEKNDNDNASDDSGNSPKEEKVLSAMSSIMSNHDRTLGRYKKYIDEINVILGHHTEDMMVINEGINQNDAQIKDISDQINNLKTDLAPNIITQISTTISDFSTKINKSSSEIDTRLNQISTKIEESSLSVKKQNIYIHPFSLRKTIGDYMATAGIMTSMVPIIKAAAPQLVTSVLPSLANPWIAPAVGAVGLAWWGKRMWDRYSTIRQHNEPLQGAIEKKYRINYPYFEAFKMNMRDFTNCAFKIACAAGACAGFAVFAKQQNQFPTIQTDLQKNM